MENCSSASASGSSSSESGAAYHVFINHRGTDSKATLASLIYHNLAGRGLRVFLDKEALRMGDNLPATIEDAILGARVHVAIFSKGYAQSTWCLDELSLMCQSGAKIIPVFYDVQPSDLRWIEGGIYRESFETHQRKQRVSPDTVENWRKVLQDVSYLSGCLFDTQNGWSILRDHGSLLDAIVDSVLKELKRRPANSNVNRAKFQEFLNNPLRALALYSGLNMFESDFVSSFFEYVRNQLAEEEEDSPGLFPGMEKFLAAYAPGLRTSFVDQLRETASQFESFKRDPRGKVWWSRNSENFATVVREDVIIDHLSQIGIEVDATLIDAFRAKIALQQASYSMNIYGLPLWKSDP